MNWVTVAVLSILSVFAVLAGLFAVVGALTERAMAESESDADYNPNPGVKQK